MPRKIKPSAVSLRTCGVSGADRQGAIAIQAEARGSGQSAAKRSGYGPALRPVSLSVREQMRWPFDRAVSVPWAILAVLLAGLLWSYWPTLSDLVAFWRLNPDYSAGALVPLVAVYVVWSRRKVLREIPGQTCWAGLVLLLMAQAVRFFGMLYMYGSLERFSFLLTIVAGCLLIFGRRMTRQLASVLVFLVLMFPLPERVHEALALPLQGFASRSAVVGLEMLGYLVRREGNVLCLSNQAPVAVAEACSGLRMLTAFVIVAAALTFVVRRPVWQKVVIIASSVPVAILANTLRLVITVLVLELVSSDAGEEFFHNSAGIVMIPFAWAVLMGELWLMRWIGGASGENAAAQAADLPVGSGHPRRKVVSNGARGSGKAGVWLTLRGPAVGAAVAVMVLAGVGHRVLAARIDLALGKSLPLRQPLSTLPFQLENWQGQDVPLDESVRRIAGDDDFVSRQYFNGTNGRTIGLYVGYMGRPRSHMAHRPDVCYPAHGFQETSREPVSVQRRDGTKVPGLLYEFTSPQPGGPRDLVLATYIINGQCVTDSRAAGGLNGRGAGLGETREAYLARVQVSILASGDRIRDLAVLSEFASLLSEPLAAVMPATSAQ